MDGWGSIILPVYSSTVDLTAVCQIILFDQSVGFTADIMQGCISFAKNALFSDSYPWID